MGSWHVYHLPLLVLPAWDKPPLSVDLKQESHLDKGDLKILMLLLMLTGIIGLCHVTPVTAASSSQSPPTASKGAPIHPATGECHGVRGQEGATEEVAPAGTLVRQSGC